MGECRSSHSASEFCPDFVYADKAFEVTTRLALCARHHARDPVARRSRLRGAHFRVPDLKILPSYAYGFPLAPLLLECDALPDRPAPSPITCAHMALGEFARDARMLA